MCFCIKKWFSKKKVVDINNVHVIIPCPIEEFRDIFHKEENLYEIIL